jgi:hypothetical protein
LDGCWVMAKTDRKFIIRKDDRNRDRIKANCLRAVSEVEAVIPGDVEVVIKKHVRNKTGEQRGWFHKLCQMLGDELGYTMGEIKELVKKDILGTREIRIGDRCTEVTESSEQQLRDRYSDLIEGVYRIGAEAGVVLPNPDRFRRVA